MFAGILTIALLAEAARIEPISPREAAPVPFFHLRTRARFEMVLFDADGRLRGDALEELRDFLTDPRSKIDHPIHWRLAALLVAIAAHYPGRTLEVVSGYRHTNRHHKDSRHTRGHAIDFRVHGVRNRELFELLRASFVDVGVGYYPNSTFVHLDVRDRSAMWVDYSGPGQTPCYSRAAARDLASGAADRLDYASAKAAGCRAP